MTDARTMGRVIPFPAPERTPRMSPPPPAPDPHDDGPQWQAWMVAAQQGDREAYRRLLGAIMPFVRGIAVRHLGRVDGVDDAVQEILLVVHDIRHTYEPGRPFKPWLATIASRRCIDVLRRRHARAQREVDAGIDPEAFADDAATPEQAAERDGEHARLHRAIGALPPRQREAVELLQLRQLSAEEAASHSGQAAGTLKVAAHRALHSLRRALRGDGHDHD